MGSVLGLMQNAHPLRLLPGLVVLYYVYLACLFGTHVYVADYVYPGTDMAELAHENGWAYAWWRLVSLLLLWGGYWFVFWVLISFREGATSARNLSLFQLSYPLWIFLPLVWVILDSRSEGPFWAQLVIADVLVLLLLALGFIFRPCFWCMEWILESLSHFGHWLRALFSFRARVVK